jgi:hypothetical protein
VTKQGEAVFMRRFGLFIVTMLAGIIWLSGCTSGGTTSAGGWNPVSTATSSPVALRGVVTSGNTPASIRARLDPAIVVADTTVTCSVYDEKGVLTPLASSTKTDTQGRYEFKSLPRGARNLILEAAGANGSYSVLLPRLPDSGEIATTTIAPQMTRDSYKQTLLMKECVPELLLGGVRPKDLDLGQVFSLISPETLILLTDTDVRAIGRHLAAFERSRQTAATQLNLNTSKLQELSVAAVKISQEIQEARANGDPVALNPEKDWGAQYDEKLRTRALEIGFTPDEWFASKKFREDSLGAQVRQTLIQAQPALKGTVEQRQLVTRYADASAALFKALRDLAIVPVAETAAAEQAVLGMLAGAGKIESGASAYMQGHPATALMKRLLQQTLSGLNLLSGDKPLLPQLMPRSSDAPSLSIPPRPDELLALQKYLRETLTARIKNDPRFGDLHVQLGTELRLKAFLNLVNLPAELGFDILTFPDVGFVTSTTNTSAALTTEIIGCISKITKADLDLPNGTRLVYEYALKPPTGLPPVPTGQEYLGYVRFADGVVPQISLTSDVRDSFTLTVIPEAFPAVPKAPGFLVTAIRKASSNSLPFTYNARQKFYGTLQKRETDYYLTHAGDTAAANPLFKLAIVKTELLSKASVGLGKMVRGEGVVLNAATDRSPAFLDVVSLEVVTDFLTVGPGPIVISTTNGEPTTPTDPATTTADPVAPVTELPTYKGNIRGTLTAANQIFVVTNIRYLTNGAWKASQETPQVRLESVNTQNFPVSVLTGFIGRELELAGGWAIVGNQLYFRANDMRVLSADEIVEEGRSSGTAATASTSVDLIGTWKMVSQGGTVTTAQRLLSISEALIVLRQDGTTIIQYPHFPPATEIRWATGSVEISFYQSGGLTRVWRYDQAAATLIEYTGAPAAATEFARYQRP